MIKYNKDKVDIMQELFEITKKTLNLINEIVYNTRIQYGNSVATGMQELTQYLNKIISIISKGDGYGELIQVMLTVLNAILDAQENRDFVLLADILESDLTQQLVQIQQINMQKMGVNYNEYWKRNSEILKKTNSALYYKIQQCNLENVDKNFLVIPALNGQPTMKYIDGQKEVTMHSIINPEKEAEQFSRAYYNETISRYFIFGIGMGYHVKALLGQSKRIKVVVLERNVQILRYALEYQNFTDELEDGRLKFVYNSRLAGELEETSKDDQFLIHQPSLEIMPDCEEKQALENYFISFNSVNEQKRDLDDNFFQWQETGLLEASNIFNNKVKEKKLVIVAAGPSLQRELENIKKYRKEVIILSVGTVAQKLIDNKIIPDFIIITDAWDGMYHQVEKIKDINIPLLVLTTAAFSIQKHYKGKIYLLYQNGYDKAEAVARKKEYPLYQVGGSVITLALDLAIRSKPDRIILVGADMAYTDNRQHAFEGKVSNNQLEHGRLVKKIGGGYVATTKNLDIYRKWIEKRLQKDVDITVYNVSYGAKIQGTIETSFAHAIRDTKR